MTLPIRKTISYLTVMSAAFLIGCLASRFFVRTDYAPRLVSPQPKSTVNRPTPPTKWRKIKIARISFSVPDTMRPTGLPGNADVVEALEQNDPYLYLNYAYGKNISSDANGSTAVLSVDGHPARLSRWEPKRTGIIIRPGDDMGGMKLVVSDVGDGPNKFELYCMGYDMNLMTQIIDTVSIEE